MNTVHALYFKYLPNTAHYAYFLRVSGFFTSAGQDVQEVISPLLPEYNQYLTRESTLMQWARKSLLTEHIAKANKALDFEVVGIKMALKAAIHVPDETLRDAAKRLLILVKNYGDILHASYDEEAGDIRLLLENLTGPYAPDVTLVGITNRVTFLQTAFNTFMQLLLQREADQMQKPTDSTKEVRSGIESVYREMIRRIDAGSALGVSTQFDDLIDKLNIDIDRVNAEFHPARKDIGKADHLDIESVGVQPYTGQPVVVIPNVWYRENEGKAIKLIFAKDFTVTYKNNTNIGSAALIVHGKGKYKGRKIVTFNIKET